MTGSQRMNGRIDDQADPDARLRPPEPASDRDPAAGPAMVRATDPRLTGAGVAAAGLMALQRHAGNAAVAALLDGEHAVQRAPVEIGEMSSNVRMVDERTPISPEMRTEIENVVRQVSGQVGAGAASATGPVAGQSGAVGAAGAGGAGTPPAPSSAPTGPGAGAVTSDGANTTVNGAHITLAAPMTESEGVVRANTVIADTIVASTYTPGAGNVW